MTVFTKLNLKDQTTIVVLNAPTSFEAELTALGAVTVLRDAKRVAEISFALAFTTTQEAVDHAARAIAPRLQGDGIIWLAYPKATSKRYKCDFNRDTGWAVLGALGFEPVRQVAIDDDWSALRFRRVEHIKTMTRTFAMTEQGQAKAAARKVPKKLS
jgi:hypothetical protein